MSSSWPGVFGLTKSNEGQARFSVFAQFHPKGWRTKRDQPFKKSTLEEVFAFPYAMMVTLDGFFEGPNHDIDWHNVDEEFNEFAIQQLDDVDTLLFGRVTYEGMASYWPTQFAKENDPVVADKMNTVPKIVFSRTLDKAEWNNSRLVKEHIAEEVSKLKQQQGRDLAIFGSSDLAVSLLQMGLIDEWKVNNVHTCEILEYAVCKSQ